MPGRIRDANATLIVERQHARVDEFFTPDYVAHTTERELTGGPTGMRRYLRMLDDAFSDLGVEVEVLVASGDRVAWQRTFTATQSGPFRGFPASHRRIVWRDMVTSRFEGERIAEEWVVSDLAERLLLARKA